jgi:putative endonuclease
MKRKQYHVYILSNRSRSLYIGSTSALLVRIAQHRVGYYKGHTSLYRIHRLVYYEELPSARAMVQRERQLKVWTRKRKIALITSMNPAWNDLAADWALPDTPRPSATPGSTAGASLRSARQTGSSA